MTIYNRYVRAKGAKHLIVAFGVDARCTGNHQLVVGVAQSRRHHHGQVFAYFTTPRTRHQCNDWSIGMQRMSRSKLFKSAKAFRSLRYFFHRGIAHIFHLIGMAAEKFGFKRQDRIEAGDVALNILHPVFLPRPHLRGNKVETRNTLRMCKLRHFQVERRIINQNQGIGAIGDNGLFGSFHKSQNGGQMQNHVHKAHVSHVAKMDERLHPGLLRH